VTVTGRAVVSAFPARLSAARLPADRLPADQFSADQSSADGEPWLAITSWAGPWPVDERWWHPASASRKARFQLVTGDGSAWLATVQNGRWLIEAGYDLLDAGLPHPDGACGQA
jgi:protein ImuB